MVINLLHKLHGTDTKIQCQFSVSHIVALFCVCSVFVMFCVGLVLLCSVWFSVGNAQESIASHLNIAPAKFELEVKRGDVVDDFVRIINRGDVAMPIEARVLNFTAEDYTGTITFGDFTQNRHQTPYQNKFDTGQAEHETDTELFDDTPFSPRKWITVENPYFILDSGESERVDFNIEIPENAEPGGHYAIILFEPKLDPSAFEEGASIIVPEIGALLIFTVDVEGVERSLEPMAISSFGLPEKERMTRLENIVGGLRDLIIRGARAQEEILQIVEKTAFDFTLGIKNNDILHFRPQGLITIYGFRGNKVSEVEVKPQTILPGKIREFRVEFEPGEREGFEVLPRFISSRMFLGNYSAVVQLQGPEGFSVSDVFTFWIFPWKFWSIFLIFFVIILVSLIKFKHRLGLALKVLFWPGRLIRNFRKPK